MSNVIHIIIMYVNSMHFCRRRMASQEKSNNAPKSEIEMQNVSHNVQGHVDAENLSREVDDSHNDVVYSKPQKKTQVTNNANSGLYDNELAKDIDGREHQENNTINVETEGDYDYSESMMREKEKAKPKAAKILNNGVHDSRENEEDSYNHLNDQTGQNGIEDDEYDHLNKGRNNASNYPKSTKATDNVYSRCANVNSDSAENEYGYSVAQSAEDGALRQPKRTDNVYSHVSDSVDIHSGDDHSGRDEESVDTNDIYVNTSAI